MITRVMAIMIFGSIFLLCRFGAQSAAEYTDTGGCKNLLSLFDLWKSCNWDRGTAERFSQDPQIKRDDQGNEQRD